LEGTHPTLTHVPPTCSRSIIAVRAPRSLARMAAAKAAEPEPTTTRSKSSWVFVTEMLLPMVLGLPSDPVRSDPPARGKVLALVGGHLAPELQQGADPRSVIRYRTSRPRRSLSANRHHRRQARWFDSGLGTPQLDELADRPLRSSSA
jgi:hypothetical protein